MRLDMIGSVVGVSVDVEIEGLTNIVMTMETGLDAIYALTQTVKTYARKAQAMAVRNVSGVTVTYSGGTFVVNRQTGKLARSIQIVPVGPLATNIVAGAAYASAVEGGTKARDLKAVLMGKTIPILIRGKAAKAAAIKSGSAIARPKYASTGKHNDTDVIAFRKIGPNSKGWIIPAQKPRPFMQATAEAIEPDFNRAVAETFAKFLSGES